MPEVEKINPYGDGREKTEQVRVMFDHIAPAYDFMNRAMTFGVDKQWRASAVKTVTRRQPVAILDVACGTADLAIALARKLPHAHITGIDLSPEMTAVGRKKVARRKLQDRITLTVGDCLNLPFEVESFDCVTVAYGVRNFSDLLRGYEEIYRVLRPGGLLCVLELSTPRSAMPKAFYRLYTHTLVPALGRIASHDRRAYSYLPESIAAVPQRQKMTELISQAGFKDAKWKTFTFGTCGLYTARKE